MADFLVEAYVSLGNASTVRDSETRARRSAEELTREGTAVRYLCSIFVPADEICFYLYQAESADAARRAAERAALVVERVTEACLVGHSALPESGPETSSQA